MIDLGAPDAQTAGEHRAVCPKCGAHVWLMQLGQMVLHTWPGTNRTCAGSFCMPERGAKAATAS